MDRIGQINKVGSNSSSVVGSPASPVPVVLAMSDQVEDQIGWDGSDRSIKLDQIAALLDHWQGIGNVRLSRKYQQHWFGSYHISSNGPAIKKFKGPLLFQKSVEADPKKIFLQKKNTTMASSGGCVVAVNALLRWMCYCGG